jgi:hypothetical protein
MGIFKDFHICEDMYIGMWVAKMFIGGCGPAFGDPQVDQCQV